MGINVPSKIIVHHTAVSGLGSQFSGVNEYHRQRFDFISSLGYWVGYHYFIEKSGKVIQARADREEGAHTKGENTASIGICLAGNFDAEQPTSSQILALTALIARLVQAHGISPTQIFPHRRFAQKSCYGSLLSDSWILEIYEAHLISAIAEIVLKIKAFIENIRSSNEAKIILPVSKISTADCCATRSDTVA